MEANSERPALGEASSADWRTQLSPEARQRIVNKIFASLECCLPTSVPEGLNELRKIALRFEEKMYTTATSQFDYLRMISLKMLAIGRRAPYLTYQNPADPEPGDFEGDPSNAVGATSG